MGLLLLIVLILLLVGGLPSWATAAIGAMAPAASWGWC